MQLHSTTDDSTSNARVMITAATLVDFAYPILMSFCVFLSSLFLDSATDDTYRLYTVKRLHRVSREQRARLRVQRMRNLRCGSTRAGEEKGGKKGENANAARCSHLIRVHPVNAASHGER